MILNGCLILFEIFFSSTLEMLSCPLLVLYGRLLIRVSISNSVQGCKNSVLLLLSICPSYDWVSSIVVVNFSAYFSPTVEKNSQNVLVMLFGSYLSRFSDLMLSMTCVLLFAFPIILLINYQSLLLSCLNSVHLSCRYFILLFLNMLFNLFL